MQMGASGQYMNGSLLELGTMQCKTSVNPERFWWEFSNALN